jgi:hypothetical protein
VRRFLAVIKYVVQHFKEEGEEKRSERLGGFFQLLGTSSRSQIRGKREVRVA